jgi:hypothetical protein
MEPMPGAIEAVKELSEKFYLYVLSTAPWNNQTALRDKQRWIKKYFGEGKENPFYKRLRNMLQKAEQISLNFQGGNWGLACNALHFIDLLSFFTDSYELELTCMLLNNKLYKSKREGFIEFNGALCGRISHHIFHLYSNSNNTKNTFTIISDVLVIEIEEQEGKFRMATKENDWKLEESAEKIVYFQSELTNILVDNLVLHGTCDLPTYIEAMKLHIPFIKCLLEHINRITGKIYNFCPIT